MNIIVIISVGKIKKKIKLCTIVMVMSLLMIMFTVIMITKFCLLFTTYYLLEGLPSAVNYYSAEDGIP
jgi:hypothetical protein